MSGFTQFILGALLKIIPGLGAWGGPLGAILSLLLTESAKIVYLTIHDLVIEAEDSVRHPEFHDGGDHGFDKFNFVFDNVWKIILDKGVDLARRQVSFLIELAVSAIKK